MPTRPQSPAAHHYIEAEQGLASLGALGADDADRITEVLVSLTHAVLSISAAINLPQIGPDRPDSARPGRHPSDPDFGRDF